MAVDSARHYRFLPPETLESLKNVELVARQLVEGTITGLHRSPYHGFSSEFAEYRKYCPGDSVRFVDWLAYAKTDRYYVKQFEDETNARVYVLLDTSGSMGLGPGATPKFNYACYLAAAFIYLMQRQRDAVGLFTYAEQVNNYFPPQSTRAHMLTLLNHLESCRPAGRSDAAGCFARIAESVHRRSLILIFSDFFDPNRDFVHTLAQFRYQQCEVLLLQILDPLELDFPFDGLLEFEDLETGAMIEVESQDARQLYFDQFNAYMRELRRGCGRLGIGLEQLDTRTPFIKALAAYFHKRERLL